MRIIVGAALSLVMGGAALAADLPVPNYYTVPGALTPFSWAGPYLGGNIGYEWGWVGNNATKPSGLAGGLQAGYNWQIGQFVAGAETDIQAAGASDTVAPWQFSNPWFGTLRGRAGVGLGNVLVYGTAGLAYGELTADSAGNLSESHTGLGWTAGAGVEVGFAPRWSAKAEWLYLDLASHNYSLTATSNGLTANLIRLGVNYHF
jgi:outer membrane immunogenic protein